MNEGALATIDDYELNGPTDLVGLRGVFKGVATTNLHAGVRLANSRRRVRVLADEEVTAAIEEALASDHGVGFAHAGSVSNSWSGWAVTTVALVVRDQDGLWWWAGECNATKGCTGVGHLVRFFVDGPRLVGGWKAYMTKLEVIKR